MTPTLYEGTETEFKTNGLGRLSDMGKCLVTEERNGAFELECEYPLSGVHFSEIKYGRIIFATPSYGADPEPFEIYKITKPLNGISTIYARHISYRLSLTPVLPFSATSCPEALSGLKSNAVESCPFTFYTDKTTSAAFSVTVPSSIRSLLGGQQGSILDVFGTGEYKWNRFKVSFLKARGEKKSVKIAYGKNLTDLKQEENIENTVTGIVPYWKGSGDSGKIVTLGQKVVQSDYADSYPYHRTIPVDFTSKWQQEPTEDQLLQAAQAYIKANDIGVPKVSIDVSFVNLADTVEYAGLADEDIRLCDTVTVAYEKLGVTATAKVTKTVWNVLLGRYDSISLGDAARTLASTLADRTRQLQSGIASAASMSARNDDLLSQKIAEQARADKAAWESYADKQTEGLITTYFTDSVPVDGLDVGDLWFNTAENNSVSRWNGNKWESVRDTDIAEALKQAGDAQATADGKINTFAQDGQPIAASVGDLWIDTDNDNCLYRWSGSEWVPYRDALIEKYKEGLAGDIEKAKTAASDMIKDMKNLTGYAFIHYNSAGNPYEFIVANNTNLSKATKVWRWNQSGLAFSSTGYNGNYSAVALTSDGKIVADRILTGTLTANIIKAGILSDKAGLNSWNLVTGAFSSIGTITNYYRNGIIGKYVFTRITDGAVEIGTCDDAKGTNANVIGSVTISKYYTDNVGYNSFGISSNNPVFISSDNVVGIVGGGQLYDGGAIVSSGYVEFNRTGAHGLLHDEEGYSGILKFGDGQIEVRDGIIIESLNTYGGSGSTDTGGGDDGGDIIVEG